MNRHSLSQLSLVLLAVWLSLFGSCHKRNASTPEAQIAVTLDPHPESTRGGELRLTGRAPSGATLRIRAVGLQFDHPVAGGSFAVDVPLRPNRLNRIQVVPRFPSGTEGLPITTQVVQDQEPPDLWIDTPADGSRVAFDTVIVNGRIADRLLGSQGITVVVNGVPAVVAVGIGTNGTFLAKDVPLDPVQPRIEAVATDVLGNSRSVVVSVARSDGLLGRVSEVFGNCQSAGPNQLLTNPIGLRVLHSDGNPFPDKVVTFDVVRSDGGVAIGASPFALRQQVRTNSTGLAQVIWRTGTDAGCGNNRVLARVADVGDITFFASTAPSQPTQINIGDGNNQRAETRGLAPLPLSVWVNDGCNGVRDVEVTFTVTDGGGRVGPAIGQMVGPTFVTRTSTTGHASVRFELGTAAGLNHVQATFSGNPGLAAVFQCIGLERDPTRATSFEGTVFDNAMQPLGNATCLLEVDGITMGPIMSDPNGRFVFDEITGTGTCLVRVEGATVNLRGGVGGTSVPAGSYPRLTYETQVVANARNALSTPVLLPQLDATNSKVFDNSVDVELTVEAIEGLKMVIKAGSMRVPEPAEPTQYWVPSATRPAIVSLNQVHTDDVPMPLPDGAAPSFTWTLQPAGALFDPPVEVTYPNMTGLAPGTTVYFLSFDHDVERFGIVATGRVREDGSCSATDQGSGIRKAGWGCSCPPYAPVGSCTDPCEEDPSQAARASAISLLVSAAKTSANLAKGHVIAARVLAKAPFGTLLFLAGLSAAIVAQCVVPGGLILCIPEIEAFMPVVTTAVLAAKVAIPLARVQVDLARTNLIDARDSHGLAVHELSLYTPICEGVLTRARLAAEIQSIGENMGRADQALQNADSALQRGTELLETVEDIFEWLNPIFGAGNLRLGENGGAMPGEQEIIDKLQQLNQTMQELGSLALTSSEHMGSAASDFAGAVRSMSVSEALVRPQSAVISIGGQTTVPAIGGNYLVGNIAANGELVRATITWQYEGGGLFGVSDYVVVPNGGVVVLPPIPLTDEPPPRVERLRLRFSGGQGSLVVTTTLPVQIYTDAFMSNGTVQSVPGLSQGTTYSSSNSGVVRIGPSGLLEPQANGVAFVTARNEGVTAIARLVVSLGDPLTTVEGVLRHEDGAVGSNLQVVVSSLITVQSDASGAFHAEGIPSQLGAISVVATGFRQGRLVTAHRTVDPIPGGITDVGLLTLVVTEGLSLRLFKGAPGAGSPTPFTVRSAGQPTLHTTEAFVPSINFPATTNGWFMHSGPDGVPQTTLFSQPLRDDITFVPDIGGVFSGRLIGSLLVPQAGDVTFSTPETPPGDFVLSLDVGTLPVFAWPYQGGSQTVHLEAGPVPIQLDFHSSWTFRLQLSASGAGFPGGILSPNAFGGVK